MHGFFISFIAIAIAELGDKTQISLLLLASRHKNRKALLAGAMSAFLLVDGAAVVFGALAGGLVPEHAVKTVSGILFLIFGAMALREAFSVGNEGAEGKPGETAAGASSPFAAAFAAVSLLEWGDKTQGAAAVFAAKYDAAAALAGSLAALALLSAAGIWLGSKLAARLNKKIISLASGAIFLAMGAAALFI